MCIPTRSWGVKEMIEIDSEAREDAGWGKLARCAGDEGGGWSLGKGVARAPVGVTFTCVLPAHEFEHGVVGNLIPRRGHGASTKEDSG